MGLVVCRVWQLLQYEYTMATRAIEDVRELVSAAEFQHLVARNVQLNCGMHLEGFLQMLRSMVCADVELLQRTNTSLECGTRTEEQLDGHSRGEEGDTDYEGTALLRLLCINTVLVQIQHYAAQNTITQCTPHIACGMAAEDDASQQSSELESVAQEVLRLRLQIAGIATLLPSATLRELHEMLLGPPPSLDICAAEEDSAVPVMHCLAPIQPELMFPPIH